MWVYFNELTESISSVASAATRSDLVNGLKRSAIANKTSTHRAYYSHECEMVLLTLRQSGITSEPSAKNSCLKKLTSSWQDSLAKILAPLAKEEDSKGEEADSSTKSFGSQKSLTQRSSSLKTSQRLDIEGFLKLHGVLPKSGMIVAGLVYQPRTLALRTEEKDGSYWLTPTATSIGARSMKALDYRKKFRASIGRKSLPPGNLLEQVLASGDKPCIDMEKPTGISATGKLNPVWVEWLMGFPSRWSEISALEMQLYRYRLAQRLKS